jgi:hypothetical protein
MRKSSTKLEVTNSQSLSRNWVLKRDIAGCKLWGRQALPTPPRVCYNGHKLPISCRHETRVTDSVPRGTTGAH